MDKKAYIQVYTGNGKGKTTCSVGQGIRAAGRGYKVLMVQFLKSMDTGEMKVIEKLDNFDFKRIGCPRDFTWNLSEKEIEDLKKEIKEGFSSLESIIKSSKYDMIILDEILGSITGGFLSEETVIDIISNKNENVEIILTGRNASKEMIEAADLVTEMKEIKHYYEKGVNARKGIEF